MSNIGIGTIVTLSNGSMGVVTDLFFEKKKGLREPKCEVKLKYQGHEVTVFEWRDSLSTVMSEEEKEAQNYANRRQGNVQKSVAQET